ncbi:MAG: SRPBCC family protein [Gemmatimonadaceae bacterium]
MSATLSNKPVLRVAARGEVGASASDVYRMIADYHTGHPRIVPPRYFRNLQVDEGGYGAGTSIRYDLIAFGKTYHSRARITEPDPGRVLVETELEKGAVTTFYVEPLGSSRSMVTISTVLPVHGGLFGAIERAIMRRFFDRVYAAELARIDEQVRMVRPVRASPTVQRGW